MGSPVRCEWCESDPLYIAYHDCEWGVPVHDDRHLFEMLILEGAQAGLSWFTILKKRSHYKEVFDNFDIERVASYTEDDFQRLLSDPGIVRNRLKVRSSIINAQAAVAVIEEFGSLDRYIWQFVDFKPVVNRRGSMNEIPALSPESVRMSRDLKKRGFKFVGSTICYAYMQSVGMVNDHLISCFRYKEV